MSFVCFRLQHGSRKAESNLKFLTVLKDPCHELTETRPCDIPKHLPKILSLIRMIWINSEFYKSREALTGIFKKVDNLSNIYHDVIIMLQEYI